MTFVRNKAANRPGTPQYMPKHARTGLNFLLRLNHRHRASFRVERAQGYLRDQFRLYYERYVYERKLTPSEAKQIDRVAMAAFMWLRNHDYLRSLGQVTRHGRRQNVRVFQVVIHPFRNGRRDYRAVPGRQKPRKQAARNHRQVRTVSSVGAFRPKRTTPIVRQRQSGRPKRTVSRNRPQHLPPRVLHYIIAQAPPWVLRAIKTHSRRKRAPTRIHIGLEF
jgi:hypothetical protein